MRDVMERDRLDRYWSKDLELEDKEELFEDHIRALMKVWGGEGGMGMVVQWALRPCIRSASMRLAWESKDVEMEDQEELSEGHTRACMQAGGCCRKRCGMKALEVVGLPFWSSCRNCWW